MEIKKKNILIIKQYESMPGGTEYHTLDLIKGLEEYNFYILCPLGDNFLLDEYKKGIYIKSLIFNYSKKNQRVVIKDIIEKMNISLIHVHHLLGFDKDILDLIEGLKIIITVHDVYYLSLLSGKSKGINTIKYDKNFQKSNKTEVSSILNKADLLIFPSKYLLNLYKNYLNIKTKSLVIEHGIEINSGHKKRINMTSPLKIGFIGLLAPHKGIESFLSLIDKLKNNFKWYIFGNVTDEFNKAVRKLNLNKEKSFSLFPYEREKLASLIKKAGVDLFVFPSVIPESFSYTLSEVLSLGIPVIANNTGAVGERIRKYNSGWLVSDSEGVEKVLIRLNVDRDELKKVTERTSKVKIPEVKEMIKEYKKIYRKNTKKTSNKNDFSLEKNYKILELNKNSQEGKAELKKLGNSLLSRIKARLGL